MRFEILNAFFSLFMLQGLYSQNVTEDTVEASIEISGLHTQLSSQDISYFLSTLAYHLETDFASVNISSLNFQQSPDFVDAVLDFQCSITSGASDRLYYSSNSNTLTNKLEEVISSNNFRKDLRNQTHFLNISLDAKALEILGSNKLPENKHKSGEKTYSNHPHFEDKTHNINQITFILVTSDICTGISSSSSSSSPPPPPTTRIQKEKKNSFPLKTKPKPQHNKSISGAIQNSSTESLHLETLECPIATAMISYLHSSSNGVNSPDFIIVVTDTEEKSRNASLPSSSLLKVLNETFLKPAELDVPWLSSLGPENQHIHNIHKPHKQPPLSPEKFPGNISVGNTGPSEAMPPAKTDEYLLALSVSEDFSLNILFINDLYNNNKTIDGLSHQERISSQLERVEDLLLLSSTADAHHSSIQRIIIATDFFTSSFPYTTHTNFLSLMQKYDVTALFANSPAPSTHIYKDGVHIFLLQSTTSPRSGDQDLTFSEDSIVWRNESSFLLVTAAQGWLTATYVDQQGRVVHNYNISHPSKSQDNSYLTNPIDDDDNDKNDSVHSTNQATNYSLQATLLFCGGLVTLAIFSLIVALFGTLHKRYIISLSNSPSDNMTVDSKRIFSTSTRGFAIPGRFQFDRIHSKVNRNSDNESI